MDGRHKAYHDGWGLEGALFTKVYDITRDKIELKDSEARGEVVEQGTKADGTPWRIGVINLPSFYMDMAGARQGQADYKSSTRDTKRLLEEFKQKGVDCEMVELKEGTHLESWAMAFPQMLDFFFKRAVKK